MTTQFQRFLRKHCIEPSDILYILRNNGKTVIHLLDGRAVETFSPLKTLVEQLGSLSLLCVNKGIVLNEKEIISVEKGHYTMSNGVTFRGRIRTPGAHNRQAALLKHHMSSQIHIPMNIGERFSVLDQMPLAFCVMEIVFDKDGHGIDFIFRYCNKAMEEFEQKSSDEILNHSCYEIFPDSDKKWAISYAEVALNGITRDIQQLDSIHGTTVTVHCFQPREGYCACVLVENK